jgi:hypothetical protein
MLAGSALSMPPSEPECVKNLASAISSGQSVSSCALRYSQRVEPFLSSALRSALPRGILTPSARLELVRSGWTCTTAIEGVGVR